MDTLAAKQLTTIILLLGLAFFIIHKLFFPRDEEEAEEKIEIIYKQTTEEDIVQSDVDLMKQFGLGDTFLYHQDANWKPAHDINFPSPLFQWKHKDEIQNCNMNVCFNFAKCFSNSGFKFYFYEQAINERKNTSKEEGRFMKYLLKHPLRTFNRSGACIGLYLIMPGVKGNSVGEDLVISKRTLKSFQATDNIILVNFGETNDIFKRMSNNSTGRAIIAQNSAQDNFQRDFDILLPVVSPNVNLSKTVKMLPIRRQYFISFLGKYTRETTNLHYHFNNSLFEKWLESLHTLTHYDVIFDLNCKISKLKHISEEYALCHPMEARQSILQKSTFSLIVTLSVYDSVLTHSINTRLVEALRFGAIPVIIGDAINLPLQEVITWHKACVFVSFSSIQRLHILLETLPSSTITAMKVYGQYIFKTFLSSHSTILKTIFLILQERLNINVMVRKQMVLSKSFNRDQNMYGKAKDIISTNDRLLHNAGDVHHPFSIHGDPFNYDTLTLESHRTFEVKYEIDVCPNQNCFYEGVCKQTDDVLIQVGQSAKPKPKFTAMILTFNRERNLATIIEVLTKSKHLHKILIVWNGDLEVPEKFKDYQTETGVEVVIIRTKTNSLNNRFIPYDSIETDGIFSLDDDNTLSPSDIDLAFRVWTQEKDRIVGFPGRYHSWSPKSKSWKYKLCPSEETSVVLTGAAFFHKYFLYMYSYVMQKEARQMVDHLTNCEDVAMNFLIAHVTRKPPIKIQGDLTDICKECKMSLSIRTNHMMERDKCLNVLAGIYGYMPLLYTNHVVRSSGNTGSSGVMGSLSSDWSLLKFAFIALLFLLLLP